MRIYYEILINGASLGVFGRDSVCNMHLALGIEDGQDVLASAVCEEAGSLWLYDWLQHPVRLEDKVEFRRAGSGPSKSPRYQRRFERAPVER